MAIIIKKVRTKKDFRTFIRLNYELYKNNPYSVPDLYDDMVNTLSKDKNAAFEFCEAEYFLAFKDDKPVGRVAAIINNRANETWNKKEVRFGWIDFIDDAEVSKALIDEVEKWGKERGQLYIITHIILSILRSLVSKRKQTGWNSNSKCLKNSLKSLYVYQK